MKPRAAAFAIPGDITTLTGGYIYERRLLHGLRDVGHDVQHIELAASFPEPSHQDMVDALDVFSTLDTERALILDGLVFGSIEGLSAVAAPIVAMIHHPLALETGLTPERKAHLFETEHRNLRQAHHVIVPSRHTALILETEYDVAPNRITLALPGTDRHHRQSAPVHPPLILSVGLQHPRKGHDVLLCALAQIVELPWRAVIVGRAHDPSHAAELARMVTDLGLASRVELAGAVPRHTLERLYAQATLFALATRYEGYGIVFDEALSWGLPIVSCRSGAVPDTVPAAAGLLTPPEDPDAFAKALQNLLVDSDLRGSLANASARAGANLPTWEDTARVASGVLNDLP